MIYLKLKSKGDAVAMLQELLNEFKYDLVVDGIFDTSTDAAVRDFQNKNQLVSDGEVYTKTWTKLINKAPVDISRMEEKFLREQDMIDLANELGIELAAVKAVNSVESSGRGFTIDGRTKILFEGHVFWKQLVARNINPEDFVKGNENVLYPKWTKKHYVGGKAEYDRLDKAIAISKSKDVAEAAYASASYGLFQIMGFHYKSLGFDDIIAFVGTMKENEGEHLRVFARFVKANNLVGFLKDHQWAEFALRYNGKGFKANKYDEKLEKAYQKYNA
ncbi:DUF3380 domain-containing protein [Flavihumibacter sp. R14]|nr:DUF3380 domain-containing protein [Flavihumibacter soli]